jgi:PAS domain-containing protein
MKRLDQTSPLLLLVTTIVVSAVPFLMVELFNSSLYRVMGISPYLVFHNIAEFFSVMVSFSVFGLGWYVYDQNNDRHSLFLSVAFLGIGLMDFMHTLGYAGMPPLITPNVPNKSIQFWIAVRFFSASVFLASAYIPSDSTSRWLSKASLMMGTLVISLVVFVAIIFFPEYLPAAFVQGVGLTPFKKISEYVIILLLVLASIMYWRRLSRTGDRQLNYYLTAFVVCIFCELSFTLYKSAFDSYNILGHIYKIAAFMLIYKGIFIASIRRPYEELRQNRNMLSHIINSIPQSLFWKDKESIFLGCNQVFARQAGIGNPDEIVGKSDFDLPWKGELSEGYRADDREVMNSSVAKYHIIENLKNSDNEVIWIDTTKVPLTDSSGTVSGVVGTF